MATKVLSANANWAASTAYSVGARVHNDTPLRMYVCVTAGTSAGSGGPTGTGTGISDGSCVWDFVVAVDYATTDGPQNWYDALASSPSEDEIGVMYRIINASGVVTAWGNNNTGTFSAWLNMNRALTPGGLFARPSADITLTNFTDQGGGTTDIFNSIDEVTPADSDYVESSSPPSGDVYECRVGTTSPPVSGVGCYRHAAYRIAKDTSAGREINVTIDLVRGTTIVRTWTHNNISNTPTTFTQLIPPSDDLGDYTDLRLRFTANNSGGGPARRLRVYWAEVQTYRYRIILRPATGEGWRNFLNPATDAIRFYTDKGVAIRANKGNNLFATTQNSSWIEDLMFENTSPDFDGGGAVQAREALYRRCVVERPSGAEECFYIDGRSGNSYILQCVGVQRATDSVAFELNEGSGALNKAQAIGCTGIHPSDDTASTSTGASAGFQSPVLIGCAIYGFSNGSTGTFDSSSNYNSTDGTTIPGANSQTSKTFANQFVATTYAALDVRVKDGADLINAGGTPGFRNLIDLYASTRGDPAEIGALEKIAAAAKSLLLYRNYMLHMLVR